MIHARTFESFPYTSRAAETPFKKDEEKGKMKKKENKFWQPSKCECHSANKVSGRLVEHTVPHVCS